MFAAATSLSNSPLPPRLFTFDDDDDAGPLSVDWAPLELEFGPEVENAQRSKAHSKELKPTTMVWQQQQLSWRPPYPPLSKMDWANSLHLLNRTPAKDGSSVLESVATWQQPWPQRGWSYCPMVLNADVEAVSLDYVHFMSTWHCHWY